MTLAQLHTSLSRRTGYAGGYVVDGAFTIKWRAGNAIPPLPAYVISGMRAIPVRVSVVTTTALRGVEDPPTEAPLSLKAALGAGALLLLTGVGVMVASTAGEHLR